MGKTCRNAALLSDDEKFEILSLVMKRSSLVPEEWKEFPGAFLGNYCMLSSLSFGKKTYKYLKVSYNNHNYKLHQVAGLLNPANQGRDLTGLEASHLCGNKRCFTVEHIYYEDGETNKTRCCCHKYLGVHPRYVCPHTPTCVIDEFDQ